MNVDAPDTLQHQRQRQDVLSEVFATEKQLFGLVFSKGLLHREVQNLYQKVRASYENIIINNYEVLELQEVEYHLWKLHYKLIDEFRKIISQRSANGENKKPKILQDDPDGPRTIDRRVEEYKSFLYEAADFYKKLMKKLGKNFGLSEGILLDRKADGSISLDQSLHKFQYVCHRFLICLGDLSRYTELCEKPDCRKWSTVALYYLQATRICPDSGNPHNQLALLATYVGDALLALYHCVRSLAVKEPFPDAWNNLMLLFDQNRSSYSPSLCSEAQLDFLKPSERTSSTAASNADGGSSDSKKLDGTKIVSSGDADLWPCLVRTLRSFLVRSSVEDITHTLASTLRELELLLEQDDEKLRISLESYQNMDSSRRGPYRAVILVSIFIFIIHIMTESAENKESEYFQQSALKQLAVAATFIFMGRLVDRCLKSSDLETSPLLPAVLVFLEWFVGAICNVEKLAADRKVSCAVSYFFDSLSELLNRLDYAEVDVVAENTALWEDYELRGFEPLSHAHSLLDFTGSSDYTFSSISQNLCRSQRIFHAAMQFDKANEIQNVKRIVYDKSVKKFRSSGPGKLFSEKLSDSVSSSLNVEEEDPHHDNSGTAEKYQKEFLQKGDNHPGMTCDAVTTEDEEEILFKPIRRHNSLPLYTSRSKEVQYSAEGPEEQGDHSDECLRRANSLFTGQSQAQLDTSSFCFDTTNARYNNSFRQQEPLLRDSATYPAGPPSLSAWVLSNESPDVERDNGASHFDKQKLSPIAEMASESFSGLSVKEAEDTIVGSGHVSTVTNNSRPPYVAPVPSAPLLPDDAIWFRGSALTVPDYRNPAETKVAEGILGASPISGYTNFSAIRGSYDLAPGNPGLVNYPPVLGMSSSEWLYHYRNSYNLDRANNHIWPVLLNAPVPLGNHQPYDISRFSPYDHLGTHWVSNPMVFLENPQVHPNATLAYGADEVRRDPLLGYRRPSPHLCGTDTELSPDQPALLQYLKEREWKLQRDPQLRGPTFMG